MKIYTIIEQNDKYIKLSSENEITIIPIVDVILVDDNSGYISIKNTASRKTIGLIKKNVEPPTPPTPTPITDLMCKYNVTSTSSETALIYSTLNFDAMYVDGSYKKFARTYTFDTLGEHTVKFILEDNTKINNDSFRHLTALTSVTIPDSVTEIGNRSFFDSTSLASVTIGTGVEVFKLRAFYGCTNLTSVTINATTPPHSSSDVFDNTNANLVIYVPAESVDIYKTNYDWSTYADRIQPIQ